MTRVLELGCRWFYLAFTPLVPVARPFAWLLAGCPDPRDFPTGQPADPKDFPEAP